jgi:hypothetical protein
MGQRMPVPSQAGLGGERKAGSPSRSALHLRHRSPQRELGDCDVAYQSDTARLVASSKPGV